MKPHQLRNLADWAHDSKHPRITVACGRVFLDMLPVTWCEGTTWTCDPERLRIVLRLIGIEPENLETTPALRRADRTAAILCCGALFVGFALVLGLLAAMCYGICKLIEYLLF